MFTKVGVKQLTDFLRTVTADSDLVDCTLVNCDIWLPDKTVCFQIELNSHMLKNNNVVVTSISHVEETVDIKMVCF